MKKQKRVCKKCEFLYISTNTSNKRLCVYCHHPNQDYIFDFFEKNRMIKYPGFLCFTTINKEITIKTSPKWCPLKNGSKK